MPVEKPVRKLAVEFIGTAGLLAAVVGSGIMGERLAGGNVAIALLANSLATAAMLFVLITMFAPISGAHFNPAVTMVAVLRRELGRREALSYILAQMAGAIVGVWIAHIMFDVSVLQLSRKIRSGPAQWFSEAVAAFGLLLTIIMTLRANRDAIAASVSLYIMSAYWFTASTSFANPAVTLARALSDSFSGIQLADVAPFVVAQLGGAVGAYYACRWLLHDATLSEVDQERDRS